MGRGVVKDENSNYLFTEDFLRGHFTPTTPSAVVSRE